MNNKVDTNSSWWANIIKEVKTPVGLFALVVLVCNGILGYAATQATGTDLTLIIIGLLVLMLFLVVSVAYIASKSRDGLMASDSQQGDQVVLKHEVFVSAPMAGYEDEEKYKEMRQHVLKIMDALRKECKFTSVVYAGRDIESIQDFEAADLSVNDDFSALKSSKFFLLLYPEKIVSSVLFEAGWGLALDKPSIYFVRNMNHLPFLMKQASQAFKFIRIYEYKTVDDILRLIKSHREKLFPV